MNDGRWILLTEDNPKDADLTIRALKASGHTGEVILACDGADALDCLYRRGAFRSRDHGQPALVLLDLKMPKVDGLEVLRQIKGDATLRVIPVVVFSSSYDEDDVARAYHLGANAFVVKPVDFAQCLAALKGVRVFWLAVNEPPPEGLTGNVGVAGPDALAA